MSALTDFKTYLETEAATLDDDNDKYACLLAIAEWYRLKVAMETAQATDVTSYTDPSGASVTRRSIVSLEENANAKMSEIQGYIKVRGSFLLTNVSGNDQGYNV